MPRQSWVCMSPGSARTKQCKWSWAGLLCGEVNHTCSDTARRDASGTAHRVERQAAKGSPNGRDGCWHASRVVDTDCMLWHGVQRCVKAQLIGSEMVRDDVWDGQQQHIRLKVVICQTHSLHRIKHGHESYQSCRQSGGRPSMHYKIQKDVSIKSLVCQVCHCTLLSMDAPARTDDRWRGRLTFRASAW